jgi:hypothetical protein
MLVDSRRDYLCGIYGRGERRKALRCRLIPPASPFDIFINTLSGRRRLVLGEVPWSDFPISPSGHRFNFRGYPLRIEIELLAHPLKGEVFIAIASLRAEKPLLSLLKFTCVIANEI